MFALLTYLGSAGAGADEPEKERSDKPRKKTRRLSTEKFPTEDTSGAVVEEKEDDARRCRPSRSEPVIL
eukprot:s2475_g2.t1